MVLEKADREENDEESKSDHQDQKEKHQIFKLEVWFWSFANIDL